MANTNVYPFGTGGQLPSSIGIINDLTTGGADKALSAQQGVVLNERIGENGTPIDLSEATELNGAVDTTYRWYTADGKSIVLPVSGYKHITIKTSTFTGGDLCRGFLTDSAFSQPSNGANVASSVIGDVFALGSDSSTIIPIPSGILYLVIRTKTGNSVSLINSILDDTKTGLYKEIAEQTEVEIVDGGKDVTSDFSFSSGQSYGSVGGQVSIDSSTRYSYTIVSSDHDGYSVKSQVPLNVSSPSSLIQYVDSNGLITRLLGTGLSPNAIFEHTFEFQEGEVSAYISGATGAVHIFNPINSVSYVPVVSVVEELSKRIDDISDGGDGTIKTQIDITPYIGGVLATAMNFIVRYGDDGGVEKLYFSRDLGKTWTSITNTIGSIVHAHIFTDGTIMLCSRSKVYWTKDFSTLTESSVYDENGDPFVGTDSFNAQFIETQDNSPINAQIDDGVEMHVWGDYVLSGTCRIWYTRDYGHTIKCAAKANGNGWEMEDGTIVNIRHIHRIKYRKEDGKWYINAGDSGNECVFVTGEYDVANDTWTWRLLAQGQNYKFGGFLFSKQGDCIYALSDYTQNQSSNGLFEVAIPNIGDISMWNKVFSFDHCNSKLITDFDGNKVVIPDVDVTNYFFVANKNNQFVKVAFSGVTAFLGSIIGPNYNGDYYCTLMTAWNNTTCLNPSLGSVNLTQMVRDLGIGSFMRNIPM